MVRFSELLEHVFGRSIKVFRVVSKICGFSAAPWRTSEVDKTHRRVLEIQNTEAGILERGVEIFVVTLSAASCKASWCSLGAILTGLFLCVFGSQLKEAPSRRDHELDAGGYFQRETLSPAKLRLPGA